MLKVMIRKFKSTGELIALFPTEFHYHNECSSYLIVGQHGGANYEHVLKQTCLANKNEQKIMLKELKKVGYTDLKVSYRRQYDDIEMWRDFYREAQYIY
jgi:hypothetical protein